MKKNNIRKKSRNNARPLICMKVDQTCSNNFIERLIPREILFNLQHLHFFTTLNPIKNNRNSFDKKMVK